MENRDAIVEQLRNATYAIKEAYRLAPSRSNLSDDLDKYMDEIGDLLLALQHGEYDAVGADCWLPKA